MAVLTLLLGLPVLSGTTMVVAMHLGRLHPYERWLAFILAFGPFIVLGIVIWVRTKQAAAEEEAEEAVSDRPGDPPTR